jgi:hypothetical protein
VTPHSLLPDELLQQLIAVGQVDVLVGIPTLNNAATIGDVVRTVHRGFARYFPRDRTVLISSDGGSEDGTRAIVRDLSIDDADTLTMSHSLRTVHRISTPYHGMPGKGSALRQIFAAADLLQARAVAVLDADVTTITPEWIHTLLAPVRTQGFDFVTPIYARHPLEGPLVTQLVRPLMRAAYGWRMAEPQAPEFGCSGRFVAHCLDQEVWDKELVLFGIDLWLTTAAVTGAFRCCEAALGPRILAPSAVRPSLTDAFAQVVGSLFACLEMQADVWLPRQGSQPVPAFGTLTPAAGAAPLVDGERLLESFGANLRDLRAVLDVILEADTQSTLADSAQAARYRFPDDLWVATAYQFLAAHHDGVMRRDHVTQALLPLYLGRTGAFVLEHAQSDVATIDAALESLAQRFESAKPYLVQRWTRTHQR